MFQALLSVGKAVKKAGLPDPVPDEIWDGAAKHFDERGLAGLLFEIPAINVWNRLNVSTRRLANYSAG